MKHSFKRALSAFLALLLLCVSFAPAAAAAEEEYPIIYISGMGSGLVDKDGKSIAAADVDKDYIVNSVKDVLKQMPIDPNGNWDKYCDALYDCFSPIYDDIRLDKNGEPSDGSHSDFVWRKEWLGRKTSNFKAEDYNFYYDWRVDPFVCAAELSKYIDAVREVTGKSKVTLVGRCLGSCIVTAYLQMTENVQNKVKNVIYYAPSVGGIGLLGALSPVRLQLTKSRLTASSILILTVPPFLRTVLLRLWLFPQFRLQDISRCSASELMLFRIPMTAFLKTLFPVLL